MYSFSFILNILFIFYLHSFQNHENIIKLINVLYLYNYLIHIKMFKIHFKIMMVHLILFKIILFISFQT